MKTAIILLFAGLVSCGQLFVPGKEYVYNYNGRILTGLPQLDQQYAGMSLQGQIIVQAESQNTYKMQMKNIKFGTFNQKLSGSHPESWRNVELEANQALSSQWQQYMESPVEFSVQQGEISMVKVDSEEPNWSVNMKKALISQLKIQLPSSQELRQQQEQSSNPRFWYIQQKQQMQQVVQGSEDNLYYWTVMEEGIEGNCENTYQVSELPEYMIHEYEQGMIKTELCQGQKYYQVLRTRDITKCQESSVYVSSKGHKNCVAGNCDSDNTKQSTTRYYGCGSSVQNIQLHGMIQEGEMAQNVVAFNTEKVVTGTKQVLKLQQIRSVSSAIPSVSSPRSCKDLTYEYTQNKQVTSRQEQIQELRNMAKNPRTFSWLHEVLPSQVDFQQLKSQIVQKLEQVAQELEQSEHYAEKEIPAQLKELKTIVSVLNTQDIHDLFNQVKSLSCSQQQKETVRSLFFDIVRNAGSPSTIMFLKDAVEKELLTETENYYTIVTLAHYIRVPTEELIHEIFQMIKSNAVQSRWWLKGSANMVFANIVRNACLGSAKAYYPEQVFGKMCSSNNQKISQEYVPYLVSELKNAQYQTEKRVAIYALGQLGHESVLPLLISYLEGQSEGVTEILRKDVIYALSDVAHYHRYQLLPVFSAIAHNPSEARSVRLAAITMIFKMQPETVHLQKLAVSTWFEQDYEVARFIYSALRSQAYLRRESHPEGSYLQQLSEQAKTVLPLAKPFPALFSVNAIYSGYLENLEIGAYMLNSVLSGHSVTEIYHKTEYFLKQVQTTPMEFAVSAGGFKPVVRKLMNYFVKDSNSLHPELKTLIEKLEISAREDTPFNAGAWLRLSDDINFAFEINQEHMELFRSKVLKAVKNSGLEIMTKICGRTPVNFQNVFEELPYQSLVPSDLGLPVMVESQMTYFYSVQGELNLECSLNKPSATMELASKMSYTYNGQAGTICPFTQEQLMAGINIHRASNLPIKTNIEIEPRQGLVKISMTQNEQVTSSSQNIDVHHYHVKPYTVKKPFVFKDLTPAVTHQNTKYVQSRASKKTYSTSFGQPMGLSLSYNVETECDVFDAKTLVDTYGANFNWNPVAATWFSLFAETALTAEGKPTARYHKYTLVHNPSASSTKGAEMSIRMSLASKEWNQQSRKISVESSSMMLQQSSRTDQKLEDCLRKLDSKLSYALNANVQAKLIGGQQKTYSYSITAGAGQNTLEHKWNFHFENDEDSSSTYLRRLCIDGQMRYPTTPNTEARFKYTNRVGFGQTCDQYYVNVEGQTQVSSKQREFSSNSEEYKKCHRFTEEEERFSQKIKSISHEVETEEKLKLEKKHSEIALKKIKYCSKKVEQSRTLDETDFTITYSQSMPQCIQQWAKSANTILKAMLFPYISKVSQSTQTSQIRTKLYFHQTSNTVTIQVESPEDTVVFQNVRLGYLGYVCPFIAGENPVEKSYKKLTGKPLFAKCVVGKGYIQSFDKKTYSYQIDECDHVVSSDCSKTNSHTILTKEVNGLKQLTVYQGQVKIELSPAQTYSSYVDEYILTIDGQQVSLKKNEKIQLKSSQSPSGQITAFWSPDNYVVIETATCRVSHHGQSIVVEEKSLSADGSHCGLCGDYNGDKRADIKSPKECVLSSNKLSAMAYRSKSSECQPLPSWALNKISSEHEKCLKYTTKKTKVTSVFKTGSTDSTTIKKHSYIYKDEKICISQEPVVQCSVNSIPKDIRKKTISFVCLPEGRVANLYQHRIENGESPQELRQQPVAFKAVMEMPVECKLKY